MKIIYKYLTISLLILSFMSTLVAKEITIPKIIKSNIVKQYRDEKIKFLSIKKISSSKYTIIIETEFRKDKVVINKKGKILSISEYLEGLDPSGGC